MEARAFTVASLAEAWGCSEGVIRKAIAEGELGCFRLGALIRIPVEEVRRFECQNIPSSDCEEDTRLSGATRMAGTAASSTPRIAVPPKRRRVTSGATLPPQRRRSAG
jgi:excisionase family DNA binding protein